jgi:flagellar motor switch protein FliN/FliY
MAGESPSIRQEDIEELLQQAQMAAGLAEQTAAAQAGGAAAAVVHGFRFVSLQDSPAVSVADPPRATPDLPRSHNRRRHFAAHCPRSAAIASVDQPADPGIPGLAPFQFKDLAGAPASGEKATLELLQDVDLDLRIELGRTSMHLEDVLKLKRGSVVPLDKLAGEPSMCSSRRMVVRRGAGAQHNLIA